VDHVARTVLAVVVTDVVVLVVRPQIVDVHVDRGVARRRDDADTPGRLDEVTTRDARAVLA